MEKDMPAMATLVKTGLKSKGRALAALAAFFGAVAGSGCAHGGSPADSAEARGRSASFLAPIAAPVGGWKALDLREPLNLRLKGELARVERARYCAKSAAKTFAGADLRGERDEATEFTVETRTVKIDAAADRISQALKTTQKEGAMDLREFAMPEKDEKLDLILSGQGKVLRAGSFPPGSLYYVPTVSLPEAPVNVGDTWTMQAAWSPTGEDSVLRLDMLSILKGIWSCGADRCAEIEVSGGVTAAVAGRPIPGYRNDWRGRLLLNVDAGVPVWSRLESDEAFEGDRGKRMVFSSLEGTLIEPSALRPAGARLEACASGEGGARASGETGATAHRNRPPPAERVDP
jgi:hypothetical protein